MADDRAEATGHPSSPRRERLPTPRFDHLRKLTSRTGLWEHAEFSIPRVEHGLCTDDNARALVVVCRQTSSSERLEDLADTYLRFVLEARIADGTFHNRRSADEAWIDKVGSDDSQGRAWWALGVASRLAPAEWMRRAASEAFDTCATFDSPHLRSNAYATLGAVEMLTVDPDHAAARDLLTRASGVVFDAAHETIPWPEARITYDNARLPEALLSAGAALGDHHLITTGLRLLEWLVAVETSGNHYSFTPTRGWVGGEERPGFDQQPIEAWAMADGCQRAWLMTGQALWRVRALRAGRWLMGDNDTGMAVYDPDTGSTADGLMEDSINHNRGAESTLAGIATLQIAAAGQTGPPPGAVVR